MEAPKTILIVQIGKIGDMILTTPLFSELKKLFPESFITVLASNLNKDIALNNSFIDKVLLYKKNIFSLIPLLFSDLKYQDIWIDTKDNYSKTSEILLKHFKPKKSLGYNFKKIIFDIDLKNYKTGNHAVEINLAPVFYFTNKNIILNKKPFLEIPESIKSKVDLEFKTNPFAKNILINVSAGDESRYITKENWVNVINQLNQKGMYFFYLIGLERDKECISYILKNTKRLELKYIKTKNILETEYIVSKCDVTISPDTSIIHICSAFNIPVIGLYPNVKWNLEKFHPLSDKNAVIVSNTAAGINDICAKQIINSFDKLIL